MSRPSIVIIVSPGMGYPNGFAPTGRVRAYARGLNQQGYETRVLIPAPSEQAGSTLNTQVSGTSDGVAFEYTSGTVVRPRSFVVRRLIKVRGLLMAVMRLVQLSRTRTVRAILLYTDNPYSLLIYRLAASACRSLLIVDKSELPEVHLGPLFRRLFGGFYISSAYRVVDGVIAINRRLELLLGKLAGDSHRVLYLPVMIDVSEIGAAQPAKHAQRYIAHCGRLTQEKDGIFTLLEAFALVAGRVKDVDLLIVGDNVRESAIPQLRSIALKLGVEDRVIFLGAVDRETMLSVMVGAAALVLARPDNEQTRYNFPTKLAEYLASGRPVVATTVGEVSDHLSDASAKLVPPGDSEALARGIEYVLSNPAAAEDLGREGRAIALTRFDYGRNASVVSNFIESINETNGGDAS